MRIGPTGRWVGLATLLAALLAAFAPGAQAAPSRFVYELCDPSIPGGSPPTVAVTGQIAPFDTCAQIGGWVGLEQTGPLIGSGGAVVGVPATPGGFVESENMIGVVGHVGPSQDLQQSWIVEEGWPIEGAGELRRSFYLRGEASAVTNSGDFRMQIGCGVSLIPCQAGPWIGARDIAAIEVDPHAPTLTSVTGSLLAPGVLRGHQELVAQAADVGGGIARLEVLVNGAQAAPSTSAPCSIAKVANPSYTGIAVTTPVPCPNSYKASWSLDTASYPFQEGTDAVQVCASDFATFGEPNRTCSSPRTVTVDNSCTESPVAGGSTLSTHFARNQTEEVTVPYDTEAKVTGELANQAGEPIVGATICVQLATQGSAVGLVPAGTATTDAGGHFAYAVPAGPNRDILLGYRHDSFQIANSLRYYAHVRPTIRLSTGKVHNGDVVKISGRLPGGPAAAGRVVVMKASALHSKKWYPFGETTTDDNGVYRYKYRFDATTRTTIYRMEAAVPRQDHFPWKAGHSRPALVEVKG
ncbi:MAG: hypothetical protein ACRDPE_01985 [Solirubrobacterales bacterium]